MAESGRLAQEAAAWEAGAEGERRVAEALSGLADGPNVLVLHDRLLRPGRSQANLDHIVVSPGGAHLIDAKNWAGNVTVYQGSLWRHKPDGRGGRSSECMNAQVDQVRRMAEAMETLSSCVVDPVLCLTGRNAHAFGTDQLIRGVHVVPVDQIAHWLASRERTQPDEAVPVLAQKLEGLFPQATGPWSSLTPAPNTGRRIKSNRGSRSTPSWTNAGAPPRRAPSSRRRQTEKPRVAKGCLGLLAMMAMVLFGGPLLIKAVPLIVAAVTHLATSSSASPSNALTQPGQPSKAPTGGPGSASEPPCRVLTESAISKALGVRVYPVATSLPDTCQWGLRLDDQSTVVASASTGWLPSQQHPRQQGQTRYLQRWDRFAGRHHQRPAIRSCARQQRACGADHSTHSDQPRAQPPRQERPEVLRRPSPQPHHQVGAAGGNGHAPRPRCGLHPLSDDLPGGP